MSVIEVEDVPADHRFVIRVDGEPAGFSEYARKGNRVILMHTEIDPGHEGEGLGSRLARGALDTVRAAGHAVVPLCPFIAAYISRHPEYDDLVDHEHLEYLQRQ